MEIIVTKLDNIQTNEEGEFLLDSEGGLLLFDEEDVGVLVKTHVVAVTQMQDGALQTGVSSLAEVYWNKKRTPAPDMVAPTDIAWLTVNDENGLDQEDEEDDDEEESYEEDFDVTPTGRM